MLAKRLIGEALDAHMEEIEAVSARATAKLEAKVKAEMAPESWAAKLALDYGGDATAYLAARAEYESIRDQWKDPSGRKQWCSLVKDGPENQRTTFCKKTAYAIWRVHEMEDEARDENEAWNRRRRRKPVPLESELVESAA